MRPDKMSNLQELLVIFHNVLDTDTTEKLYKDNILPKKNYDSVIDQLNTIHKYNPHKLSEEEKDIVANEASEMLEMLDNISEISDDMKDQLVSVSEYDFSEEALNASGVGEQILDIWEGFRMEEYEGTLDDNNYDYYKQLEDITFKTGYV